MLLNTLHKLRPNRLYFCIASYSMFYISLESIGTSYSTNATLQSIYQSRFYQFYHLLFCQCCKSSLWVYQANKILNAKNST